MEILSHMITEIHLKNFECGEPNYLRFCANHVRFRSIIYIVNTDIHYGERRCNTTMNDWK